jgi:hypothetical protein
LFLSQRNLKLKKQKWWKVMEVARGKKKSEWERNNVREENEGCGGYFSFANTP